MSASRTTGVKPKQHEVSDKARQTKEPGYNKGLSSVQSMDCVIADMGVTQFPKREAIKNASYS